MASRVAPHRATPARRSLRTGPSVGPRVKIWVVFDDGTKLGDGRARLFELIDELGSIQSAVAQMGMSYRAAWGYIRELETAAGFPFLTRRPGGGGTGGARLTPEGRAFVARYRRFRESIEVLARRRFHLAFGGR